MNNQNSSVNNYINYSGVVVYGTVELPAAMRNKTRLQWREGEKERDRSREGDRERETEAEREIQRETE